MPGRQEHINTYATLIEQYLKNETISRSESDIAKEILNVELDTDDDIPSSTKDLDQLAEIRESLRKLISQRKIFQTLVQIQTQRRKLRTMYGRKTGNS